MEDKKILELLWNRVETALDALAKKFGRRLLYTAMNILGNPEDAEEAVNDTYIVLWNTIPPEKPAPLAGYVHRTGRNVAQNKRRHLTAQKRNSQYDVSLEELAGADVDMFCTVFIGNEMTRVIHHRMVTPRGYRDV